MYRFVFSPFFEKSPVHRSKPQSLKIHFHYSFSHNNKNVDCEWSGRNNKKHVHKKGNIFIHPGSFLVTTQIQHSDLCGIFVVLIHADLLFIPVPIYAHNVRICDNMGELICSPLAHVPTCSPVLMKDLQDFLHFHALLNSVITWSHQPSFKNVKFTRWAITVCVISCFDGFHICEMCYFVTVIIK